MNIKNKLLLKAIPRSKSSIQALKFISIGVACNAFIILDKRGILKEIAAQGYFDEDELVNNLIHPKPIIIKAALKALVEVGIINKRKKLWFFSEFGQELYKKNGLINLIFSGYKKVLAKQIQISEGYEHASYDDYDGLAIAEASDEISNATTDEVFIQLINELNLDGTIVDLGCGSGKRLIDICRKTNKKGLGIDISNEAIKLGKQNAINYPEIYFEQADVRTIDKVWGEVDIVMQNFMVHDIVPDQNCLEMFDLLHCKFPKMKYHIVLDIVASDEEDKIINPGFEYIHSLLGIKTRTYSEVIEIYQKSNCEIIKEIKIDILPNTFIWVLKVLS